MATTSSGVKALYTAQLANRSNTMKNSSMGKGRGRGRGRGKPKFTR
jgi:hypothetical protein